MHTTTVVWVKADVDTGIADFVRRLNAIPGVRTYDACQGTIGEGGAEPYEAYVSVGWHNADARKELERFRLTIEGEAFGTVHPPPVTATTAGS